MPQIWRHLHARNRDEMDPRVLDFPFHDLAELHAKLLFNAVYSAALHIQMISMVPWMMHSGVLRSASSSACSSVWRTELSSEPTVTTLICERCHSSWCSTSATAILNLDRNRSFNRRTTIR